MMEKLFPSRMYIFGLVAFQLLLFFQPGITQAKPPRPIRFGLVHPYPRLCGSQENSQKDMRVLRLTNGLMASGSALFSPPDFIRVVPAMGGQYILLDSEKLWGTAFSEVTGFSPEYGGQVSMDLLVWWRNRMRQRVPLLEDSPYLSMAPFFVPTEGETLFFWSRFWGTAAFPFFWDGGRTGTDRPCVSWNRQTRFEPDSGRIRYRIRSVFQQDDSRPFLVTAWRNSPDFWSAFAGGGLDIALLEEREMGAVLKREEYPEAPLFIQPGTQHIILGFTRGLREAISTEELHALGFAIDRGHLARVAGLTFSPAAGFFQPLLPELGAVLANGRPSPMVWNAREARSLWLAKSRGRIQPRLAVMDHPLMVRIARTIAGYWKKTLNLPVNVLPLSPELLARSRRAGDSEIYLDVIDLDDGSMQNLWEQSQKALSVLPEAKSKQTLKEVEQVFQQQLPYLPILQNRHFTLLRSDRMESEMTRLCPHCVKTTLREFNRRLNRR